MHLSILRLLAVGLAGLDVAVAGPCKPRSSVSESSVTITVATSTFTLSSDTSATFASTTTEAVTSADTTTGVTTEVTSAVTETDTASTEATFSSDATIEATTFATSTAITEIASTTGADTTTEAVTTSGTVAASSEITETPTTTEETSTAAATTTAVPMFRLVPAAGVYSGEPLLSSRGHFSPLIFNHAQDYSTAYFTVDTTTGRLLLDGTLPICGYFPGDDTSALIVCDTMDLPDQERYLTCETPTPGSRLECSVPEVQCSMFGACTATGSYLYTTYIGSPGGSTDDTAYLAAAGGADTGFYVNFDSD
ncbi:activator of stress 1 [Fusarium denticulatum]|uniref:Activator of stress 1 n=1 Tax=Fusarium denticulatum TaxID=48507 RepID=A0A8H5XJJ9_9HYPO|nr:activator of stress 1 [Fusarium denticulatum]